MDFYPPATQQRRPWWPDDRFPEGSQCDDCDRDLTVDEAYYADFDADVDGKGTCTRLLCVPCYQAQRPPPHRRGTPIDAHDSER